jgi:hypothetical protein
MLFNYSIKSINAFKCEIKDIWNYSNNLRCEIHLIENNN